MNSFISKRFLFGVLNNIFVMIFNSRKTPLHKMLLQIIVTVYYDVFN